MLSRSPPPTRPAGFIEPCLPTLAREVPGGPRNEAAPTYIRLPLPGSAMRDTGRLFRRL